MRDVPKQIDRLRKKIDCLDNHILVTLNERAELVAEIGQVKSRTATPVYQPARETEVIAGVVQANLGPLSDLAIAAIFSQIIAAGRTLEHVINVAFLGPEHTYSHLASTSVFGPGADYYASSSIPEVFTRVERGSSDYGVVPIENSAAGAVGETLDKFVDATAEIIAETTLSVAHHLLGKSPIEAIRVVYSHPQALDQCRSWLSQNLPSAERVEVASTAAAAIRAASELGAGALGPKEGAEAHGLSVIKSDIQDFVDNTTRFLVLGTSPNSSTGDDRTALLVVVSDRVGALHDVLGVLRDNNLNLSNIQTRPARGRAQEGSGDYVFFLEFPGHPQDPNVNRAITDIRGFCTLLKVLGAWPVSAYEQ